MAVPLFIFAATVCRYIEDQAWSDPAGQLEKILQYQSRTQDSEIDKLDTTYRPILDQLVVRRSDTEKRRLVEEFRSVVGPIVLLAEALSTLSLANLLDIPEPVVDRRLVHLHSVLSVPSSAESPIRMFHLSFRDFLVDQEKRDNNPFWIDERATHERLATRCLELLSSNGRLKKDICNLEMPGTDRADVEPAIVESYIPAHVRYACLYWVYHLKRSSARITDNHQAYHFLRRYFLLWLEALCFLGKISESVAMIRDLQTLTTEDGSIDASTLLQDAARFILNCRSTLDRYPLQVYSSAIVFAPNRSEIKRLFQNYIPVWISRLPNVEQQWSSCLQTLEGHSGSVTAVAFSPDSRTVAAGSADKTVRLWDAATGEPVQTLTGHSSCVEAVAFSPDGRTVASGSWDKTVRLWDAATGEPVQTLEGHSERVGAVAFSPDGRTVASGSADKTVRLWDVATGEPVQTLEGHSNCVGAVAFSPDGRTVASGSADKTVRLWDAATGEPVQTLEGHSDCVGAVAFSPDGRTVASGSDDKTVRLWDAATGEPV